MKIAKRSHISIAQSDCTKIVHYAWPTSKKRFICLTVYNTLFTLNKEKKGKHSNHPPSMSNQMAVRILFAQIAITLQPSENQKEHAKARSNTRNDLYCPLDQLAISLFIWSVYIHKLVCSSNASWAIREFHLSVNLLSVLPIYLFRNSSVLVFWPCLFLETR